MPMPEDEIESDLYWILGFITAFVAVCIVMFSISNSFAHMADRQDLNTWFRDLKSKGGAWCCSGSDGTTLRDADWESKDGHYRVQMADPGGGPAQWYDVPDDAVIIDPNRYGSAIVWRYRPNNTAAKWVIRCFIPGAGM